MSGLSPFDRVLQAGPPATVEINDDVTATSLPYSAYTAYTINLTGTLTASRSFVLPTEGGFEQGWILVNQTGQTISVVGWSGGYGTGGVDIPSGATSHVVFDGLNFRQISGGGGGGGGVTDHGALTGLGDDDHTQYLRTNGTRALTGPLSAGGNKITSLGTPTAGTDAATKAYVDSVAGAGGVPTTRQIVAGAGLTGGGDLSADRTVAVAAADGSIVVTADAVAVGVISDAQHGTRGGGTLHATVASATAGFCPSIGGVANSILCSSAGTSAAFSATPTCTSLRAVSYLEAGTYAAVATSGVGAAAGLIAQGGGVASAGGAAFLAGGAPGSGGSGGGARLYTRGDASGATSGYLHHEVTEIQGRFVSARWNGVPITATEAPSGNCVEVIKRALVSPTQPPPTAYTYQWVGVSPGELDAIVRAGPNGLTYTNHKRVTIGASSSGTVVLGRIREDLGQYAVSPMHYKLGQAHGRIHVVVASFGSSWTTTGANEFTYHGDFTAIRLNQASPSGPPGTWVDLTPTKAALSIALDSSLYLSLTITNGTASATEAIVSWDWMQPW